MGAKREKVAEKVTELHTEKLHAVCYLADSIRARIGASSTHGGKLHTGLW